MVLTSLPDAKILHKYLEKDKDYVIVGELGNCYKIDASNGDTLLILKERFSTSIDDACDEPIEIE